MLLLFKQSQCSGLNVKVVLDEQLFFFKKKKNNFMQRKEIQCKGDYSLCLPTFMLLFN